MKWQKNQPSWNYVECFTIICYEEWKSNDIVKWNLYALVRYSNVVKVVWIAMPGVRSKRQ